MKCEFCGAACMELQTEKDGIVLCEERAAPYEYANRLMPDRFYTPDGRRIRGMRYLSATSIAMGCRAEGYGLRPHFCRGRREQ